MDHYSLPSAPCALKNNHADHLYFATALASDCLHLGVVLFLLVKAAGPRDVNHGRI